MLMVEKKEEKKTEHKEHAGHKHEHKVEEKKDHKENEVKPVEKMFTVSLKKCLDCQRTKRASHAVRLLKKIISKNFRVKTENVLVSNATNQLIWQRGIEHIPLKVKVKVVKEKDKAMVYARDEKIEKPKKEKKEEKKEEKKTAEEKAKEEEIEKKKEEKKILEKEAHAAAIKKGLA